MPHTHEELRRSLHMVLISADLTPDHEAQIINQLTDLFAEREQAVKTKIQIMLAKTDVDAESIRYRTLLDVLEALNQ